MGTVSEKLTYLNDTKQLLKTVINYADAGIDNNTTFRNYAIKLYDAYVEILKDKYVLVDEMPKGTSTGTTINITNAENLPVYELKIDKESTQKTTTGKNLFSSNLKQGGRLFSNGNYFNAANYVHNEYPITVTSGETYIISAKNYVPRSEAGFIFFNNGTFVSSLKTSSLVFTVPSGVNQVYYDFYTGSNVNINDFTEIQLEKGSTATTYEEYTGGIASPSPSFPQKVETVKGYENLFDKNNNFNHLGLWNTDDDTISTITDGTNQNIIGAYCKVESGKTYSISRSKLTSRFAVSFTNGIPQANGQAYVYHREDSAYKMENITIPTNYNYIFIYLSNTGENIDDLNLLIVEGTEELPYVPYGNNYIYTKVIGKNLFDNTDITEGYRLNSSGELRQSEDYFTSNFIDALGNTKYTYSKNDAGGSTYLCEYNLNKEFIDYYNVTDSRTITTNTNTRYLRLADKLSNIGTEQLERGEATSYEAYQENNIPIPLNNNEIVGIGDYKDQLIVDKTGHVYLNKKTGKVVYNGSENWDYQNGCFTISINDSKLTPNYSDRNQLLVVSNYFKAGLSDYRDTLKTINYQIAKSIGDNGKKTAIVDNDYTVISDFKTWLSTHNIDVYYVLETPNLIDLNTTVDISLFDGINNITNSEDADMIIRYVKDISDLLEVNS